jgi:hypothetical protein
MTYHQVYEDLIQNESLSIPFKIESLNKFLTPSLLQDPQILQITIQSYIYNFELLPIFTRILHLKLQNNSLNLSELQQIINLQKLELTVLYAQQLILQDNNRQAIKYLFQKSLPQSEQNFLCDYHIIYKSGQKIDRKKYEED